MNVIAVSVLLLAMQGQASSESSFSVVLPVRPDTTEGQFLLAREAKRHCGQLQPHLGRYRFIGTHKASPDAEAPSEWEVVQAFSCKPEPAAAATPPVTAVAPDWQPTPELQRKMTQATLAYFELVDRGDPSASHRLWSASNREMTPLEEWRTQLEAVRTVAGKPLGHRVVKLSWYVNPPDAPTPGIYVAADYEKAYEKLAVNCGFLVWFQEADGNFRIVREESGLLEKAHAAEMTAEVLGNARTQLGCVAPAS